MKVKASIVIAALMITSMAFAISTPIVSATHDETPTIDRSTLKGSTSMILTITVNNAGPGAIENVWIIMPSGFTGFAPVVKIPAENTVELTGTDNENVVLAAGTKLKLTGATTVKIPENTPLIRLAGDNLYYAAGGIFNENLKLLENVVIKKNAVENATGLTTDDNVLLVGEETLALDENDVVTLAETIVVRVTGNVVKLPTDTLLKVHDDTNARNLTTDDEVKTEKEKTLVLENGSDWVTQSAVTVFSYPTGSQTTLPAGAVVRLYLASGEDDENRVVLPAGSTVKLAGDTTVMLYENQQVKRKAPGATENLYLVDPASAENQPKNWMQTVVASNTVEWKGIGENRIASGASLAFPFAVTTPGTSGSYTVYVRTKDADGHVTIKELTLTVDATPPSITEVTVSPSWVKGNTTVTITAKASEALAKMDNVMVCENNGENIQITMVPDAEKKIWTGTYTTGDNENRDGTAKVYVIGAQYEDLVGNTGSDAIGTFTIDRRKPPKPNLLGITGFPSDAATTPAPGVQTNQATWFLEGYAQDNFLGSLVAQDMTVKIRVGTTVYTLTTPSSGYFYQAITLSQGLQEVGVQFIDKAGNVGEENVENVTLDSVKPTLTITAPENGVRINAKKPTIKVSLSDATLGIENALFASATKSGYEVYLAYDNGENIATLNPKSPPTAAPFKTFSFENDYPTELTENLWYRVYVVAGDNLQTENIYHRFYTDFTKPAMPSLTAVNNPVLYGTTATNPKTIREDTLTFYGTDLEASCKVTIYLIDHSTGETKSTITLDATSAGTFSTTLTIPVGGTVLRVEMETRDVAGNLSDRVIYGYVMADWEPPVVTLAPLPDTTQESSITIRGTVTKNSWEKWSDITLSVQVGTGIVNVPVSDTGDTANYEYSVSLSLGPNTIVVKATDPLGNMSSPQVKTITRLPAPTVTPTPTPTPPDTSAPRVTLSALPATTTDASITVSGVVAKDVWERYTDITLTVRVGTTTTPVSINTDGSFSCTVQLSMGTNTIVALAVDRAGNVGSDSATIERVPVVTPDTTPPTLSNISVSVAGTALTSPYQTDAASVTITGRVSEVADVTVSALTTVTVRTDANLNFSATVAIAEGPNTITIQAVDLAGNASSVSSVNVTRTVTPWGTYAIVIVIIVLILAAIAIFRWKR